MEEINFTPGSENGDERLNLTPESHNNIENHHEDEILYPPDPLPLLPICNLTNSPSSAASENSKHIAHGHLISFFHDWVSSDKYGCTFFDGGGIVIKPISVFDAALRKPVGQKVVPVRFGRSYNDFIKKLTGYWGFHKYQTYTEEDAAVYYHPYFIKGRRDLCGLIQTKSFARNHGIDPVSVIPGMGALRRAPKQPSTVINPHLASSSRPSTSARRNHQSCETTKLSDIINKFQTELQTSVVAQKKLSVLFENIKNHESVKQALEVEKEKEMENVNEGSQ